VVAVMAESGFYARHVERLRSAYRKRRDALVGGLTEALPETIELNRPQGGFFVWVRLPPGYPAARLLELSQANGVSFMPGNAFSLTDGLDTSLRLSFSRYGPEQLAEAARRIGDAFQRWSPES
jgi:DNA-binding transcriptional MocR family regulator